MRSSASLLLRGAAGALIVSAVAMGCTSEGAARRAKEAAERIKAQMTDPQAEALAQKAPAETVKEAQSYLQTLHEYLGDLDGKLDSVTVNAVEAFQTAHGMDPDGLLTASTMERLREAAAVEKKRKG